MNMLIKHIKWVLLISGILTSTMFYGLFAPQAALESMFGTSFSGPLENIVIRSWCALIGIIGLIMIYGFFNQNARVFTASVAALSKLIFVSLVFLFGQQYLGKALPAIVMDVFVVVSVGAYLIAVGVLRKRPDRVI